MHIFELTPDEFIFSIKYYTILYLLPKVFIFSHGKDEKCNDQ